MLVFAHGVKSKILEMVMDALNALAVIGNQVILMPLVLAKGVYTPHVNVVVEVLESLTFVQKSGGDQQLHGRHQ